VLWKQTESTLRGLAHRGGPQVGDARQQDVTRLALHQRYQTAPPTAADDRVSLPIAESAARIHDARSSVDRHRAGQTATVFRPFAPRPAEPQALPPLPALVGTQSADPVIDCLPRNLALRLAANSCRERPAI